MPEFKCDQCGKVFYNEGSLRQHVNDKHSERHEKKSAPEPVKEPLPSREAAPSGGPKIKFKVGKGTIMIVLTVVIAAGAGYGAYSYFSGLPADSGSAAESLSQPIGAYGTAHMHADYAVYMEGERIDFSAPGYFGRNQFVHMHEPHSSLIHAHATGINVGFFLRSLGNGFNSECFRLDNGREYCNEGNSTLKMFVKHERGDWEENRQFHTYLLQDLDKVLITYGDETADEIAEQQSSLTDFAIDASRGVIAG